MENAARQHVGNLTILHSAMQRSDLVYWQQPHRIGMKNKAWLGKAVTASVAQRRDLRTILGGVKDSDICQVNVFALYTLGTAMKNTLDAIAQSLEKLPGLTLVFLPCNSNDIEAKYHC